MGGNQPYDLKPVTAAFTATEKELVQNELQNILGSNQFANAPIVRTFLEYVTNEHIAGRDDHLKAYTIATEAFGRSVDFDPSSDTIVRTTAGRVRNALKAYYDAREATSGVEISLPKGGYVPSIEFRDVQEAPGSDRTDGSSSFRSTFLRPGVLIACCLFAMVAIALVVIFLRQTGERPLSGNVVINVQPTEHVGSDLEALAKEIDLRLSPALSRIRLARISPPSSIPGTNDPAPSTDDDDIVFTLKTSIAGVSPPELRWQLVDPESGFLLWASSEPLSGTSSDTIERDIYKVSFQILGENGAVPLALERYHGELFTNQACLSRAQLMRAVENATVYPEMRECLERTVERFPNDAAAWAILSTFYAVRTRYYGAEEPEERLKLIERAERAAAKAEELAPHAYLTKVALMQLALSQQRIRAFDELQEHIRAKYPGNIHLELRIASRLTRLGRGSEALEIYRKAEEDWGINLSSNFADIALAHFVEGDHESAYRLMSRSTSNQLFVLLVKVAIMGKLGLEEDAAPIVEKLVATHPDIREAFYPWFSGLNWVDPLLADLADGLAKAGLVVKADQLASDKSGHLQAEAPL
ncbi:tetratricopeptide repeat protein [Qingshengfaniella alkalisoli]|uniref:Tetratricopeptide repeat protein n=1 Tax=Qingshengfaniella alkalisoli TaxID=2599296 RepID=A0A5B8I7A0_9RHOB|nr:tetratricopeptide repeat protein [Qingshengfaniella alkalisoli]QDY69419.1 tetratricopeptide repeat protein [Qingshengfaniella alkalisoli]